MKEIDIDWVDTVTSVLLFYLLKNRTGKGRRADYYIVVNTSRYD